MFAVVQVGSTQYVVRENDELLLDHLGLDEGKSFAPEHVLLYSEEEGKNVKVGTPYLEDVKVEMKVMGMEKGKKLRVFKMKPKKRYQRTYGHRSVYTRVKVTKISAGAKKAAPKKAAAKKPAAKKAPAKKAA